MAEPIKDPAPAVEKPAPKGDQTPPAEEGKQGDLPERAWMQDLPEPLRASKTLRKFLEKSDLAKSYVELESKLGRSVSLPKEGASAEDWGEFFTKIGRPGTVEEYEVPPDKLDPKFVEDLRKKLHSSGLTKMQFKDTVDVIVGGTEAAKAEAAAQLERNRVDVAAKLKAEFGKDYEAKMAKAEIALGALFPDSIRARLISDGIKDDVEFMKAMVAYGEKFGNTQFIRGVPASSGPKADPYDWMREKYGGK